MLFIDELSPPINDKAIKILLSSFCDIICYKNSFIMDTFIDNLMSYLDFDVHL